MIKFDVKNYPGKYRMQCRTEEDARTLRAYLHSVGRRWQSGDSYLEWDRWDIYKENTAYEFNNGTYGKAVGGALSNSYTLLHFEDFDWSDFMKKKEFTKKDLKNGDVVKTRDGDVGVVIVDVGVINFGRDFINLSYIKDDLTDLNVRSCDIMAVRRPNSPNECTIAVFDNERGTLVYERKEVEEMTLEEVCKALGKEIKIVKEK